jgi:hypothetical protein
VGAQKQLREKSRVSLRDFIIRVESGREPSERRCTTKIGDDISSAVIKP